MAREDMKEKKIAETAENAAEDTAAQTAEKAADAAKASENAAEDAAAQVAEKTSDAAAAQSEATAEDTARAPKDQNRTLEERLEKLEEQLDRMEGMMVSKDKEEPASNPVKARILQDREKLVQDRDRFRERLEQLLSEDIKQAKKKEKRRSAEIIHVFASHNFYANGFTPREMRTTLEDLGPTYVKIGQIMSSRTDLLPASYCKELEKLRQNVKELDPQIARAVIEHETGRAIDEIYKEFNDKPIGSASIGQVHSAVLLDGRRVVTKVQRPLIADMMRKDFVLLRKMAGMLNVVGEDDDDGEDVVDLTQVIEELEKVTEEELDFRVEAANTRFFRENCIQDPEKVNCPEVIDELTTERIFTMTFVDGYSVSKMDRLKADGYDPNKIGYDLLENYVHQILDVGTFHADPHQGNIMISKGIPYWIDFGMVGRITDGDVNLLQNLILSLLENDLDGLVNAVMSMGATSPQTNRNRLLDDLDVFLSKYMSVTSADDLDMAVLLEEVTALATKHHISLPGKYTMLVRSIGTIEGVIAQLCPEVNLFKILSTRMMERARQSFDVSQSLLSAGKDVLSFSKKTAAIPVLASDALNSFVKGRMKMNVELNSFQELFETTLDGVRFVVMAILAGLMFLGSCSLCSADIQPKTANGIPLIAAISMLFSVALGIYSVINLVRKKK